MPDTYVWSTIHIANAFDRWCEDYGVRVMYEHSDEFGVGWGVWDVRHAEAPQCRFTLCKDVDEAVALALKKAADTTRRKQG